ncbi:MAG: hypothetical protein HQK54_14895 [Oligoflexales bacterium]|nr:hypothetical protein [Oligoflexales bacterium]
MSLAKHIENESVVFIKQKYELAEIIINFETVNRYAIMDKGGNLLGMILERSGGFFGTVKRLFLRSHRGFEVDVIDKFSNPLLFLKRDFFFFFSDLFIYDQARKPIGSVHRRFSIIYKKYDLKDRFGKVFATIESPFWRLWSFPVLDCGGLIKDAKITKRWGGILREVFTDTDTFMVDFGGGFSYDQRLVVLASSVSIDFDFFEENQNR